LHIVINTLYVQEIIIENICRTIYSSELQTCLLLDRPFVLLPSSTLNEKFSIQNGIQPDPSVIPSVKYFAIGNGGHKMVVGANGLTKTDPVQHRGTDAALYSHLPFILREISNDIDAVERAKYALRRKEVHNGTTYVAYYLKRLPLTGVVVDMEFINVTNGVQTVNAFVPNASNLNPTPPDLSSTGVNVVTGDYVAASAKVTITLSAADVAELLNVSTIIYGDPGYAIISEIGLCSGVDKVVQSPVDNNAMINFNEAIAVQVASFINTNFPLEYTNDGCVISLDIGSCEPNLSLSQQ